MAKDLCKVSHLLKGQCGLLFTKEDEKSVRKYFKEFMVDDFARVELKAFWTKKKGLKELN